MKKVVVVVSLMLAVAVGLVAQDIFARNYNKNNTSTNVAVEETTNVQQSKIEVKRVKQDDDNKNIVDIDFTTHVLWSDDANIASLTDSDGQTYKAKIIDMGEDDTEIYIDNIKEGTNYTMLIDGIKGLDEQNYSALNVKFEIEKPKENVNTLKVIEVSFDRDDREVDFEFNKNITKKSSAYVVIKDSAGNTYSSKSSRLLFDSDECDLYLNKNLTQGKKYTYKIYGVKAVGDSSYKTISGSFRAIDD